MKLGFTLSEILITLGVVGVVSAMTLPTLINNYQKMQTVNKLKADYTLVYNALKRAEVDYGDMKTWQMEETPDAFADKYLKPYLKIIDKFDNDKVIIKRLSGVALNEDRAYKHYTLSNGSSLTVTPLCTTCSPQRITIYIDINGLKEPNRVGFDIFVFAYTNGDGFSPIGIGMTDFSKLKKKNADGCVVGGGGNYCALMIMRNGWKIPDDYPWKNK